MCALVTGVQTCALPISRVLFVVATYGDGEAPDFARTFARKLREAPPDLDGLEYAVLVLGYTDYEECFCGFGRKLEQRMRPAGARPFLDCFHVETALESAARCDRVGNAV